jgi:ADP-glucose pyrophosphorylase
VGTVDAFWKANVDLTDFTPELDLWDKDWPIWTYSESVPPAKFVHDEERPGAARRSSMVAGGCIISGTEVRNRCCSPWSHQQLRQPRSGGGAALRERRAPCAADARW